MFLSPEVIIVSEFPRDSLEERQPPANTLFSTYFDTADVFSLSRIFRCRTHTILESSSKPREILCLIRGELKFESNYFFHRAIKYPKIRRLRNGNVFTIESSAPSFSVSSEKETETRLTEICVRKLSCTKFHGSRAWPGFALPPYLAILARVSPLRSLRSSSKLSDVATSRYEISVNKSPSPLARDRSMQRFAKTVLLFDIIKLRSKTVRGFETLVGSLGWNHVQSSERTLFLFDEVKVFARYICSNSSGITRIIAYRSIVSTREYTSVGRGNWRIERYSTFFHRYNCLSLSHAFKLFSALIKSRFRSSISIIRV